MGFDIAGAIGSIVGAGSQLITNNQNNKANARLQRQQQAHNEEMWRKNNEYNSPQEVLKRQREAGINPWASQASSLQGLSSAPAQSVAPAQMQAADIGSPLSSGLSSAAALLETKRVNDSVIAKNEADALKSRNEATNIGEGGITQKLWSSQLAQNTQSTENSKVQKQLLENQYMIEKMYGSPQAAATLQNTLADTIQKASASKLNDEQILKLAFDKLESQARINKLNIEYDQLKKGMPYLLMQMKLNNQATSLANRSADQQYEFEKEYQPYERYEGVENQRRSNRSLFEDIKLKEKSNQWFHINQVSDKVDKLWDNANNTLGNWADFLPTSSSKTILREVLDSNGKRRVLETSEYDRKNKGKKVKY